MDFISVIERVSGRKARMNMMEMQPGDVVTTYADTKRLERDFGYRPSTSIEDGISRFYEWYTGYGKL
jgi:UDP-glucuronate 4-epimerase